MSDKVKVVKADTNEHLARQLRHLIEAQRTKLGDMKRRFNGFIEPVEEEIDEMDRMLRSIERNLV